MTFSANELFENIQSSLHQTGFGNLADFAFRHRTTRRWIIASDFNLGSPDAAHNVFAFAAYPTGERNYFEIIERLRAAIPADFKHTRIISREVKRFFRGDDCFCFVLLAPTTRMFFRTHADHEANRREAIDLLDDIQARLTPRSYDSMHADIRRLLPFPTTLARCWVLPLLAGFLTGTT